jgi:hypothetical protein
VCCQRLGGLFKCYKHAALIFLPNDQALPEPFAFHDAPSGAPPQDIQKGS